MRALGWAGFTVAALVCAAVGAVGVLLLVATLLDAFS